MPKIHIRGTAMRRKKRIFSMILIISLLLTSMFGTVGIVRAEEQQMQFWMNCYDQDESYYMCIYASDLNQIYSFSYQFTYDTELLEYKGYTSASSMISCNVDNGTITVAAVSKSPISCVGSSFELVKFNFDKIKQGTFQCYGTAKLKELTTIDPKKGACSVENADYSETSYGYSVVNTDESKYHAGSTAISVDSGEIARVPVSIYKNGNGIVSGEFEFTYDPTKNDYLGCSAGELDRKMIISTHEETISETEKKVSVAFVSSSTITAAGTLIYVEFVPRNDESNVILFSNLKLVNQDFKEVFYGNMSEGRIYFNSSEGSVSNYFSIAAPEKVESGKEFEAVISLEGNTGFSALQLLFHYDSSCFEYVSANVYDEFFNGAISNIGKPSDSSVKIGAASSNVLSNSGKLAVVTLKAKTVSSECSVPLSIQVEEMVDQNFKAVENITKQTEVTVTPPHTHSYTSNITKEPTCTEEGERTYTCECGETRTEKIAALGHDYTVEVVPSTDTEKGYVRYTCKRCGMVVISRDIAAGTTVQTLADNSGNYLEVYHKEKLVEKDSLICTGDICKVMTKDGTEIESYIACVHGDVSGDGKIDVLDMEKIQKSILNIERLTGVYQQAGLLSGEDMLSVMDMEKIQKDVLGIKKIS